MILLLAAVASASAVTPTPAPARPVDPAALAAATALVKQLDLRSALARQTSQMVQAMKSGVAIRANLAQQPGFIEAYQANRAKFDPVLRKAGLIQAEIAEKVIRENSEPVIAEAARAYARNYSAAELKGLGDFYRTPLGQSFRAHEQQVTGEVSQATARLIGARIQAGMQANAKRLSAALAPLNTPPAAAKTRR